MANDKDIIDEVTHREISGVASSIEVRLAVEIVKLRERNETLNRTVMRLEHDLGAVAYHKQMEENRLRAESVRCQELAKNARWYGVNA